MSNGTEWIEAASAEVAYEKHSDNHGNTDQALTICGGGETTAIYGTFEELADLAQRIRNALDSNTQ